MAGKRKNSTYDSRVVKLDGWVKQVDSRWISILTTENLVDIVDFCFADGPKSLLETKTWEGLVALLSGKGIKTTEDEFKKGWILHIDEMLNSVCNTNVDRKEDFHGWVRHWAWRRDTEDMLRILSKRLKSVFDERVALRGWTIGVDYKTLKEETFKAEVQTGRSTSICERDMRDQTVTSSQAAVEDERRFASSNLKNRKFAILQKPKSKIDFCAAQAIKSLIPIFGGVIVSAPGAETIVITSNHNDYNSSVMNARQDLTIVISQGDFFDIIRKICNQQSWDFCNFEMQQECFKRDMEKPAVRTERNDRDQFQQVNPKAELGITPIDAADLKLDSSEVANSVLPPKLGAQETNVSLLSESDSDTGTEVMSPVVNPKVDLETTVTDSANLKLHRSDGTKPVLPPEPCANEMSARLSTESASDTGTEVMFPVVNHLKNDLEMTAMDTANLKLDRSEGAKQVVSDSDTDTEVMTHVAGAKRKRWEMDSTETSNDSKSVAATINTIDMSKAEHQLLFAIFFKTVTLGGYEKNSDIIKAAEKEYTKHCNKSKSLREFFSHKLLTNTLDVRTTLDLLEPTLKAEMCIGDAEIQEMQSFVTNELLRQTERAARKLAKLQDKK